MSENITNQTEETTNTEEELTTEEKKKAINLQDLKYIRKYIDDNHYNKTETDNTFFKKTDTIPQATHADTATTAETATHATTADTATTVETATYSQNAGKINNIGIQKKGNGAIYIPITREIEIDIVEEASAAEGFVTYHIESTNDALHVGMEITYLNEACTVYKDSDGYFQIACSETGSFAQAYSAGQPITVTVDEETIIPQKKQVFIGPLTKVGTVYYIDDGLDEIGLGDEVEVLLSMNTNSVDFFRGCCTYYNKATDGTISQAITFDRRGSFNTPSISYYFSIYTGDTNDRLRIEYGCYDSDSKQSSDLLSNINGIRIYKIIE